MIKPGFYRHYKGNTYYVIGTVTHSETREKLVLYTPRYENANEGLVVRPVEQFTENVTIDGVTKPRYEFMQEV